MSLDGWGKDGDIDKNVTTDSYRDYPNAWAPIQHMLIEGLMASGIEGSEAMALDIAKRTIQTYFLTYKRTGFMHEKYDSRTPGVEGGGGEYAPQKGFGWTNGVALILLQRFGQQLRVNAAALQACKAQDYIGCDIWA